MELHRPTGMLIVVVSVMIRKTFEMMQNEMEEDEEDDDDNDDDDDDDDYDDRKYRGGRGRPSSSQSKSVAAKPEKKKRRKVELVDEVCELQDKQHSGSDSWGRIPRNSNGADLKGDESDGKLDEAYDDVVVDLDDQLNSSTSVDTESRRVQKTLASSLRDESGVIQTQNIRKSGSRATNSADAADEAASSSDSSACWFPESLHEQFSIIAISPVDWTVQSKITLDVDEHVSAFSIVPLRSDYSRYPPCSPAFAPSTSTGSRFNNISNAFYFSSNNSAATLHEQTARLQKKMAANASFNDESMLTTRDIIVVGTTKVRGEEVIARGRVLLFDLVPAAPLYGIAPPPFGNESSSHSTPLLSPFLSSAAVKWNSSPCYRLVHLHEAAEKASITCVAGIPQGLLLVAMKQKLFCYRWDRNRELLGIAMTEMDVAAVSMKVWRNIIYVGDIDGTWSVVEWRADQRALTVMAKSGLSVMGSGGATGTGSIGRIGSSGECAYLVSGSSQRMVVHDEEGNLAMMQFTQGSRDTLGTDILLQTHSYHLGGSGASLQPVIASYPSNASFSLSQTEQSHIGTILQMQQTKEEIPFVNCISTSHSGSFSSVVSINHRDVVAQLRYLSELMTANGYYLGGTNPTEFRVVAFRGQPTRRRLGQNNNYDRGTVLDGEVILKFLELNYSERELIAQKMMMKQCEIVMLLDRLTSINAYIL